MQRKKLVYFPLRVKNADAHPNPENFNVFHRPNPYYPFELIYGDEWGNSNVSPHRFMKNQAFDFEWLVGKLNHVANNEYRVFDSHEQAVDTVLDLAGMTPRDALGIYVVALEVYEEDVSEQQIPVTYSGASSSEVVPSLQLNIRAEIKENDIKRLVFACHKNGFSAEQLEFIANIYQSLENPNSGTKAEDDLDVNSKYVNACIALDESIGKIQDLEVRKEAKKAKDRVVSGDPDSLSPRHFPDGTRLSMMKAMKTTIDKNIAELQQQDQKKLKRLSYPASYKMLTRNISHDPLNKAKMILVDYTKNNSTISRLFHGHGNRHHVNDVSVVVENIENGNIKNLSAVIKELKAIQHMNPNGSLSKRIKYIEAFLESPENIVCTGWRKWSW